MHLAVVGSTLAQHRPDIGANVVADVPPIVISWRLIVVANVGATSALRHANVQFDVGMLFCQRRHDVSTSNNYIKIKRQPSARRRLVCRHGRPQAVSNRVT